jgi:ABC-type multidrug transport system fused ATPase/permease subunit
MTKRIRTDYFRTLLRQEIGWFDLPANSLGVLTSRLAIDVKLIRLTVGQSTGATVSSMTSLLVGVTVALVAAWQFALAFLATVPLLALTEMINWALMKGGDSAAKKVSGSALQDWPSQPPSPRLGCGFGTGSCGSSLSSAVTVLVRTVGVGSIWQ